MCLILFAWQAHPRWGLVLAANRDERHDRPSAAAAWWPDHPDVYGGRDLSAGGTWLGVTRSGRFAAITNYRDLRHPARAAESRGALVRGFLTGTATAHDYLNAIRARSQHFLPFNLLVGDGGTLACLATEAAPAQRLGAVAPGLHGLSNHLLDSPWPKVARGREALARLLGGATGTGGAGMSRGGSTDAADSLRESLFNLLADRRTAPDQDLPQTGLPLERERQVSASMIVDPVYGTRCASVLLVSHDGSWTLHERSFDPAGSLVEERRAASTDRPPAT